MHRSQRGRIKHVQWVRHPPPCYADLREDIPGEHRTFWLLIATAPTPTFSNPIYLYPYTSLSLFTQGNVVTLEVDGGDTILLIKQKLHVKEGIDPADLCFFFAGTKLEGDQTLDFVTLEVEGGDTIRLIKKKLHDTEGIDPADLCFFFAGTKLEDDGGGGEGEEGGDSKEEGLPDERKFILILKKPPCRNTSKAREGVRLQCVCVSLVV